MRKVGLAGLLAVAATVWPFIAPPYLVFLTTLMLVNGIVALGLNLLTGYTNQLSFGHAGFVANLGSVGFGFVRASHIGLAGPPLQPPRRFAILGVATHGQGNENGCRCSPGSREPPVW